MELDDMLSELCTAPLNEKFKSGCDIDELTDSLKNWISTEVKIRLNDTKISPTLFEPLSEWLRIGFEIYDQKQQQPGQNAKGNIVYQVKFFGGDREQTVEFSISDSMVIDEQNNITAMSQHQKYENEYLQNNDNLNQDSQAAPIAITPSEAFNHNFLPSNELMNFLSYSLQITDKQFQEHDIDTLGFIINLFNYDISSCRLSIQQNADKSYGLQLSSSQLIDPNEGISLSTFYTALADINLMAQLSEQISALFVSIHHSEQNIQKNSPQDLTIDDLVVLQMQRIKKVNKKLAAEKQELIENFEYQFE